MTKCTTITAKLGEKHEKVYISENVLDQVNLLTLVNKYDKILLVMDENVKKSNYKFYSKLMKQLDIADDQILKLKPKPNYKEFSQCGKIVKKMTNLKFTRNSCLIACGGGYVADISGFTASIYMRGIDFIQIPTTLMSMGDSIMGKVAINFGPKKNVLGSFFTPRYVLTDTTLIKNLPKNEIVYGLVEIWKHLLLKKDKQNLKIIAEYLKFSKKIDWNRLIKSSLVSKKSYVTQDFNDRNGKHKAVSLGHTFANYLEHNPKMRHGVAVFYGILFSLLLSDRLGLLSKDRIQDILNQAIGFEKHIGKLKEIQKAVDSKGLQQSLKSDKITGRNGFTFVVLTNKGYDIVTNISTETVNILVKDFKALVL